MESVGLPLHTTSSRLKLTQLTEKQAASLGVAPEEAGKPDHYRY